MQNAKLLIQNEGIDINSIIQATDESAVKSLLGMLSEQNISIIKPPQTGLLMMTVQDSFDTDFYLGEILVTEAEVECRGKTGYAMVMGDEPERALLAASVDAVMQGDNEDLKKRIRGFVSEQMEKINSIREKESALVAKTKVSFESMSKG
ncbi:MAG: phosphonate C-P lyase system protein PhnG [Nitrospirae bacterium]|nr:phosphonate C-P lyase system protein PhnG [Nitrospirota bacterium]MCL5421942.1 phosphonate C-P lyase system protein PhnG [Nitrospirota bacterium]